MRCEELQSLLDLYLDDELSEEARRRIDRHMLRCPACAFQARSLEQTGAMLREAIPPAEATPAFRERTHARLLTALEAYLRPAVAEAETGQRRLPLDD